MPRREGSEIRRNIELILYWTRFSYGYDIYKIYKEVFEKDVLLRSIYYNLKKGVELGEIVIVDVRPEIGEFTWGNQSERVYYTLGPYAKFDIKSKYLKKLQKFKRNNIKVNWKEEVMNKVKELKNEVLSFKGNKKDASKLISRCEQLKKWVERVYPNKNIIDSIEKIKGVLKK